MVSNTTETLSRGCCGAAPVLTQRCQCCCFQTGEAAISTQQSCQPLMNLRPGYSMDRCLLLILSQALCDALHSSHLLQFLPFSQQIWGSGKNKKRKGGRLEKSLLVAISFDLEQRSNSLNASLVKSLWSTLAAQAQFDSIKSFTALCCFTLVFSPVCWCSWETRLLKVCVKTQQPTRQVRMQGNVYSLQGLQVW